MLPCCIKGDVCTNFKFSHCSKFKHEFRIKECSYPKCKLLHDAYHTKLYTHIKQYKKLSDEERYLLASTVRKNCPKWIHCDDYSHEHCSKHNHPYRKKFCVYYDCKLSHDENHMLKYNHEYIYANVQISKSNYNYNLNHSIFGLNDIWSIGGV